MTQPTVQREAFRLDRIATILIIVLCTLASAWIGRDLVSGGKPTRGATPTRQGVRTPSPPPPLPVQPISIDGAVFKGNSKAKVALVIYSDFQCPFCGRFATETWPALDSKYVAPGNVRVAFRHLPLESIHASALIAAEAAECASQQRQFWPMHDVLFRNQKQLAESNLTAYARETGLDLKAFETCLKESTPAKIRADAATGAALGITGTPSFLIGLMQADGRVKVTERLSGARPFTAFETALDKVLAASESGTR